MKTPTVAFVAFKSPSGATKRWFNGLYDIDDDMTRERIWMIFEGCGGRREGVVLKVNLTFKTKRI
jgi:hypothetical protein